MKIHIETERLLMRDLMDKDVQGMFAMDSDPEVHAFLGNRPISTLKEAEKMIGSIKQQYIENGIGRWAVVEKETNNFVGWSGFKLMTDTFAGKSNFYDLGYRFLKGSWGKGYATETAMASLNHGFAKLDYGEICGMADVDHIASNAILKKIGLIKRKEFIYDGTIHNFYSLSKSEWNVQ